MSTSSNIIIQNNFDMTIKDQPSCQDQHFYGHGKLLFSGEYFILDGVEALALPTKVGQSLSVKYESSFAPKLYWKSYDINSSLWFEASFEFWQFDFLGKDLSDEVRFLQKLLRQARRQNTHFLRDNVDVLVETRLGFPLEWGLGSSSSLIYNIAQWAYISPFELLFNTQKGSGYDVACAQSDGPILYQKGNSGPHWRPITFSPSFKDQLYFVYLGKKQCTADAINHYLNRIPTGKNVEKALTEMTNGMLSSNNLFEFERVIEEHEKIVANSLKLERAKNLYFSDYWGEVKSLGAWGGDFVLVTSDRSTKETREYFLQHGYKIFIPYNEMILEGSGLNSGGISGANIQ